MAVIYIKGLRDVGDIHTRDQVGAGDIQVNQQIGFDKDFWSALGKNLASVDRLLVHDSEQPTHTLRPYDKNRDSSKDMTSIVPLRSGV